MKDCPECGEQVADDAVHCGHCGSKVEEERSEKQTMFGVGTVDADSLKSAVDEAQGEAGDSDADDRGSQDDASAESGDDQGSGGFRLPTPGEAGAESVDKDERENSPVSLSEDEDSTVEASGLPEPSDVGDGRLSAPKSESDAEDPSEESAVDPDAGVEVGDEPMLGETLAMESPPEVQEEPQSDESSGSETPETEDAPPAAEDEEEPADTVPTDMSPPGESSNGPDEQDEQMDVPGELAPTRREVETVDDEPGADQFDQADQTESTPASDVASEEAASPTTSEPATGEETTTGADDDMDTGPMAAAADDEPETGVGTGAQQDAESSVDKPSGDANGSEVATDEPSTSAGSRFEQAEETAPPQTTDPPEDNDGRISTKTLLLIAAGLFVFCAVGCAGVLGLFYAGYI
jgi:hypothetical protein